MNKILFVSLLIIIILGLCGFIFLLKQNPEKTGDEKTFPTAGLPILMVGDNLIFESTVHGWGRTVERKVVGEETLEDGRVCYVETMSLDEPIMLWDCHVRNWKVWFEKDTLQIAKAWTGTVENLENMENFFLAEENYSHIFSENMWPLEVGKEFIVTTTGTQKVIFFPDEQENIYNTFRVRIENIENVTTPAGRFECFTIAYYNVSNALVMTQWYSPTVRTAVKLTSTWFFSFESARELKSHQLVPRP